MSSIPQERPHDENAVVGAMSPAIELSVRNRPDLATPIREGLRLSTPACLGISILLIGCAILGGSTGLGSPAVELLLLAGLVAILVTSLIAAARTISGGISLLQAGRGQESADLGRTVATFVGNLAMTALGAYVAFVATLGFSRGRQLRRRGKVLLPNLQSDDRWVTCQVLRDRRRDVPAGLADQWRENGKTEHASVAAFARLTLDLMALGAPPKLVAAANQDALDEIRHAELCFSLASALDGESLSPAPFPAAQRARTLPRSRTLAFATLAVDSLVDGALHEGVSARIIAKLAQRCQLPAIAEMLKEIAADEGRHAAHGWTVVRFCLDEGGVAVGAALQGAIRALPKEMRSQLPKPAADGGWEAWGIHGHGLEDQEYRAALADVTRRVRAMTSTSLVRAA